jgi:hypothetical protein
MKYFKFNEIKIGGNYQKFSKFLDKIWKIVKWSLEKSKFNFFVQCINIIVTFLLLVAILPSKINTLLSPLENMVFLHFHLVQIITTIFFVFTSWLIGFIFNINWFLILLRTKFIYSFVIFIGLSIIYVSLYTKLCLIVFEKIINFIKTKWKQIMI